MGAGRTYHAGSYLTWGALHLTPPKTILRKRCTRNLNPDKPSHGLPQAATTGGYPPLLPTGDTNLSMGLQIHRASDASDDRRSSFWPIVFLTVRDPKNNSIVWIPLAVYHVVHCIPWASKIVRLVTVRYHCFSSQVLGEWWNSSSELEPQKTAGVPTLKTTVAFLYSIQVNQAPIQQSS